MNATIATETRIGGSLHPVVGRRQNPVRCAAAWTSRLRPGISVNGRADRAGMDT